MPRTLAAPTRLDELRERSVHAFRQITEVRELVR